MIVKSKRNIDNECLSIDKLYPVIAYEKEENRIIRFQILDDDRSLSWKRNEQFYIVSKSLINYCKINYNERNVYVHKDLNYKDFLVDFYLENEESVIAALKLEEVLISIFTDELTTEEILQNINEIGYKNDCVDLMLKTFFKKATMQEIKEFSDKVYNVVSELDNYVLQIIVDNLKIYKENEIENLFMEIYLNIPCSMQIIETLSKYFGF